MTILSYVRHGKIKLFNTSNSMLTKRESNSGVVCQGLQNDKPNNINILKPRQMADEIVKDYIHLGQLYVDFSHEQLDV